MVKPEDEIEIPVPTFPSAKVNTGLPPKVTSSPACTPDRFAIPEAEAFVVPSYALSFPVNPIMVKEVAVMSADKVG